MCLHGRRFAGTDITTVTIPGNGNGGNGNGSGGGNGGTHIPPGQVGRGSIVVAKETVLNTILANKKSRIVFYSTNASAVADTNRVLGIRPQHGHGVLAEFAFLGGELITLDPLAVLFNNDNPQTTLIYYNITNLDPNTVSVDITLNHTPVK